MFLQLIRITSVTDIIYNTHISEKMNNLIYTEAANNDDYLTNNIDVRTYIKILKFYRQVPSRIVNNWLDNIRIRYVHVESVEMTGMRFVHRTKIENDSLCLYLICKKYNEEKPIDGVNIYTRMTNIYFIPYDQTITLFPDISNTLKYSLYNIYVDGMDETLRYIKYPRINRDGFTTSLYSIESNGFLSLKNKFKGHDHVLFGYNLNPFEYIQVYALMKVFNTKPKLMLVYKRDNIYSFYKYAKTGIHFIGGKIKKIGSESNFDDYNISYVIEYLTLWSLKLK